MEINIKELIENKDILIFLENDIDNMFLNLLYKKK